MRSDKTALLGNISYSWKNPLHSCFLWRKFWQFNWFVFSLSYLFLPLKSSPVFKFVTATYISNSTFFKSLWCLDSIAFVLKIQVKWHGEFFWDLNSLSYQSRVTGSSKSTWILESEWLRIIDNLCPVFITV